MDYAPLYKGREGAKISGYSPPKKIKTGIAPATNAYSGKEIGRRREFAPVVFFATHAANRYVPPDRVWHRGRVGRRSS